MKTIGLVAFAAALCLAQQSGSPVRDGDHFVQTTTGTATVEPGGRLKVIAPGAVVVRGQDRAGLSYSFKLRAKTRSVDEARRLLRPPVVRTFSKDGWTVMKVVAENADEGRSDLELTVPKSLRDFAAVTPCGSVEAYDIEGSVNLDTAAGKVQLDRIGQNAVARTGGGPVRVGKVNGAVRCLSGGGVIQVDRAGGEVWCETAGGEIFVTEAAGPLHATTAGGNIQIGRAMSTVTARSNGGLIEVEQAGGIVMAQTDGGSIQVGASRGVQCESAAGAIRVKSVGGPLRAYTAAGSIMAELMPGVRLEDSTLNAGSGDITVFIPSNVVVSVQAWSQSPGGRGRIVSDFPEIRVRADASRQQPARAEGALNGGGPVLRITASGNIYLRRQR